MTSQPLVTRGASDAARALLLIVLTAFVSTPVAALATLEPFELLNPVDGHEDRPVWPAFTWSSAGDPDSVTYTLQYALDSAFSAGDFIEIATSDTLVHPEIDLMVAHRYRFRVIATDLDGNTLLASTPSSPFDFYQFETQTKALPRVVETGVPLESNRTLIAHNQPYTIQNGNLVIPSGVWMRMQAGTVVEFETDHGIVIEGELQTLGTAVAPVVLTSGRDLPAAGDWGTITLSNSAVPATFEPDDQWVYGVSRGTSLQYTVIEFAGDGASGTVSNGSTLTGLPIHVEGCILRDNADHRGIFVNGIGSVIRNSTIDGYQATQRWPSYTVRGGGMIVLGSDHLVEGNEFVECQAYSPAVNGNWGVELYAFGGGMYVEGSGHRILGNTARRCSAASYSPSSSHTTHAYGGGFYISSSDSEVSGNFAIACEAIELSDLALPGEGRGGGVYVDDLAVNVVYRDNVLTGCRAREGGGAFVSPSVVGAFDRFTITNNEARDQGGAVHSTGIGLSIVNSNVKHNHTQTSSAAGGLYTSASNVNGCNINQNDNHDLMVAGSTPVNATSNWWGTRSDVGTIAGLIYDGNDTDAGLGVADYDNYLEAPSPNAPLPFETPLSLRLVNDATYSTPLEHSLAVGDTAFFQLEGVDSNPYNREVAVLWTLNHDAVDYINPFFEESGDATGVFNGYVVLTDSTSLSERTLIAAPGDSIEIQAYLDPHVSIGFRVEGTLPPNAAFTVDASANEAPATIGFTNLSSGSILSYAWDFGDGSAGSNEKDPSHLYADQGLYTVRLIAFGADMNDTTETVVAVLGPDPMITSITDVPNDQGGWVFVDFLRSTHDTALLRGEIYTVERLDGPDAWTSVTYSAAYSDSLHRMQVPTLADSTAADPALATFRIVAAMDEGPFASEPSFGYSTDDIAPEMLGGLTITAGSEVTWSASAAPDLSHYRVYGGDSGDFDLSTAPFAAMTPNLSFGISGIPHGHWTVTAVDLHGNESPRAVTVVSTATPPLAVTDALLPNRPNPFNPATTIRFITRRAGHVCIQLYDVAGRRITTLVDAPLTAGDHEVIWRGRDAHGRSVASGVYLVRMSTDAGVSLSRRIALVR